MKQFVIKAYDGEGKLDKRMEVRPRHFEDMEIIRATRTVEQAGAYYVRIQAMARKHQITLYAEFDEHDTPDTNVYRNCR